MSSVKNKNTKAEVLIRKRLFKVGFRYKINDKTLPGSPDIVLPKFNTLLFIHGCFWHGHQDCGKSIHPKTNVVFWKNKIDKNRKRDEKVIIELQRLGWKIITIWECEIRNEKLFESLILKLTKIIKS